MPSASYESQLLRTLADRTTYEVYRPYVKEYVTLPEAMTIVDDMGAWFEWFPEAVAIDWDKFLGWSRLELHATWKPDKWEVYKMIAETAAAQPAPDSTIISRFQDLDTAAQIRLKADEVLARGGSTALDDIQGILDGYRGTKVGTDGSKTAKEPALVLDTLEDLLDNVSRSGGLSWRLEDLNRSVGPLRQSDLVFIAARPEVGKTTFICSEIAYMTPQLPEGKHAIIFNNEEAGRKVKLRAIQAALGLAISDIAANSKTAQTDYDRALGGRKIQVCHSTSLSTTDIERHLRSGTYSLVAINVLDKLQGFSKLEGVERIRALGIWARGIADKYGVVFATLQADASAEGERWLTQAQIYGSKTGLQGEADVQIMIGRDLNPAYSERRFLNIVKNKLPGGPKTEPKLKHGQFEVGFDGERARFYSMAYKTP
ncbi:MAG TPA: DnaB-like helicase C-terminal domain-containing protein [Nitrospiraceae bacterium]|jgi:replicative DNA helicase|nr:DnaB-like helicase C-terminal domain-containing protein [Nitrospiraceae bacterium]